MNLTHGALKELLFYDPDTGHFTWLKNRTRGVVAGDHAGTLNRGGYVRLRIFGREYTAHRVAWFYVYGAWPVAEIDHINGCRIDNRLSNLRNANRQQNRANSRGHGKSGYKGVTFHKQTKKWQAILGLNGKNIYLGLFHNPTEAHAAYIDAARLAHGEFARVS